jgi:L-rhamnose mutarotase
MKLRPGAFAEYKRLHDELWPELFAEIEQSGVATMTIFAVNPEFLVLYSEVRDEETWIKLRDSEVHQRWTETLKPLFVLNEEGTPDIGELEDIFHIRTSVTEGPVEAEE